MKRALKRCSRVIAVLTPVELAAEYRRLYLDLASLTYKLKSPYRYVRSLSQLADVVVVLDYSNERQRAVADRRLQWIRQLGVRYVLATDKPAEILAAELSARDPGSIAVTRDYDALAVAPRVAMPDVAVFKIIERDDGCMQTLLLRRKRGT